MQKHLKTDYMNSTNYSVYKIFQPIKWIPSNCVSDKSVAEPSKITLICYRSCL